MKTPKLYSKTDGVLLVVLEGEPRGVGQVLPRSLSFKRIPPGLSFCPDYPLDFPKRQRGRKCAESARFGEGFGSHEVSGFG
jgi:hypothetical protein